MAASNSDEEEKKKQRKMQLQALLDAVRPYLRGELGAVDPDLPDLVAVLRSVGAGECWHKHGTFLDHLVDMYRILSLWSAPRPVSLCGLYHSAYSNSYVNLAIFDPSTGRDAVRRLLGPAAERLVHLFCVVPRHPLIHDRLLFRYSDADLTAHLRASDASLLAARGRSLFDPDEPWRRKINAVVPAGGVAVEHIKTGEELRVSRRVVAVFLLMTMADFSDQLFGFQDQLFDNDNGRLEFKGNRSSTTLWPGDGKPGLWMNSISRMGVLYNLIAREEQLSKLEKKKNSRVDDNNVDAVDDDGGDDDSELELVMPPVFDYCTKVLDVDDQRAARDLYWEAVCRDGNGGGLEEVEKLLKGSVEKNPYVGEPRVVLGQVYLAQGRFEEARESAEEGLRLVMEWGSPWDKRMSWEGWIAWARVLITKAGERSWPNTGFGILNLGLVR